MEPHGWGISVSRSGDFQVSVISMHTPADVHYGHADAIDRDRDATLEAARRAHPERFTTRQTRPKILDRDPAAWINQPPTDEIQLAA